MTIGALALMWMETAPVDELHMNLTSISGLPAYEEAIIYRTHVPVKYPKWLNIVVSKAPAADHAVARACHFIVSDGDQAIETTDLWKRQVDGYHTFAPGHDWNSDSIGICFLGDLDDKALTEQQFSALVALVQTLQKHFKVRSEHVYLNSQLDDRIKPPSGQFAQAFADRLLHIPAEL